MKQDQYQPLAVEKQVLSIFVATSGLLDSVPVNEVRRFEKEMLQYVETSAPSILKTIAEKKALDDSIRAEIKKVVGEFKERFAASIPETAAAK